MTTNSDDANVANNVAQSKVQDLTEQWEKGELEIDKNYYLRFADGTEEIQLYVGAFLMRADNEVVEVLAPVPSYEEWLENESHCAVYSDINKWLKEENQQLKELLKEVRDAWVIYKPYDRNQLCKRIDNAIGKKI